MTVDDIRAWEQRNGKIPEGAVVFIRFDWSKEWSNPELATRKEFPGVTLAELKFLHPERKILFYGHEALDTDTTPTLEGEAWLLRNEYTQAEGVANLDKVLRRARSWPSGFRNFREAREGMRVSSPSAQPIGNTGFRLGRCRKHRWLGGKSPFIGTPMPVRVIDRLACQASDRLENSGSRRAV